MILELFDRCARATAELIASDAVAEAWSAPSALEGYTVAGLAGHLGRAVLTVEAYLDRPAPPADAHLTDAAGYLTAVLGSHDPVDSELHQAVRERGVEAGTHGAAILAADVRETTERLRQRLGDADLSRPIQVAGGIVLPLEHYLETRLVELVVHLDDLSVSVGRAGADALPDAAYATVAGVLGRVAAARAGGLATVRSLARRERHPEAVRAL